MFHHRCSPDKKTASAEISLPAGAALTAGSTSNRNGVGGAGGGGGGGGVEYTKKALEKMPALKYRSKEGGLV